MIESVYNSEKIKSIFIGLISISLVLLLELIFLLKVSSIYQLPLRIYIESIVPPIIVGSGIIGYLYWYNKTIFFRSLSRSLLPIVLIELIFTYIFLHVEYSLDTYIVDIKTYLRYYRFSVLLFIFLMLSRYMISILQGFKKVCYFIRFTVSILVFWMIFFAGVYLVYFLKYKALFSDVAFMSVMGTTYSEATEYVMTIIETPSILFVFLCVIIFLPMMIYWCMGKIIKLDRSLSQNKYYLLIIFILSLIGIGMLIRQTFPLDMYINITQHSTILKGFNDLSRNVEKNNGNIEISHLSNTPNGTIILVIGESANRDYMHAFNPKLERETTPWESEKKEDKNFIFLESAYSNYPNTALALSRALTQVNQYNNINLSNAITIIGLAKKAGYTTYWISTQEKSGVYDSIVAKIAESSDNISWLNGYDEKVLQELPKVDPHTKNLVVVHILGSHVNYNERVPKEYKSEQYAGDRTSQYLHTIDYTDWLLKEIYEYGKKSLNLNVMVYMSDHGEHIQYGHTDNPFYFEMVRIPTWIYMSDEYKSKYPAVYSGLEMNKQKIFTNDLLFELMSTLLDAHTHWYNPNYDISNIRYGIDLNSALTVHSKYHIKDDPTLIR